MSDIRQAQRAGSSPAAGTPDAPPTRRSFLKWSGAATVGLFALGGIAVADPRDDYDTYNTLITAAGDKIDLGRGDVGVLNYAYALEQLEAAFYTMVTASFFTGATTEDRTVLTDIREHEIIHREFFKLALATNAIPALTVDFSAVDFTSRDSVLMTAKTFEDTGVSAYNGGGQLIDNPDYLVVAGKIVSVEARHAAAIRDLIAPLTASFAGDDVVDPATGLDVVNLPKPVLKAVDPFIVEKLKGNKLPKPKGKKTGGAQ